MILQFTSRGPMFRAFSCVILVATALPSLRATAQSGPAELLELSIEDLFVVDVRDDAAIFGTDKRRWRLSYNYRESHFQDYLDGSEKVSIADVLFSPGEESRTDKNFPVVPTDIDQEIHSFNIGYQVTKNISVNLAVPYVKQSTDHISVVPGYSTFRISTDGLGDIALQGSYSFAKTLRGRWQVGLGLSFPTGSIDEEGDTPREPGNQQLPYSMQLGSGTYDVPAYVSYLQHQSAFLWGVDVSAKVRLGKNDRDYRLGNTINASSWARLTTISWIQPSIKLGYSHWGDISGADTSLMVPGPYPYPAPVTNPSLYGGDKVNLLIGLRIPIASNERYFELEFGKPIYQSLNGPQSSEDYRFSVTFSGDF